MKKRFITFLSGMVVGAVMFGGSAGFSGGGKTVEAGAVNASLVTGSSSSTTGGSAAAGCEVEQRFEVGAGEVDFAGGVAGQLARVVAAQDVQRPGDRAQREFVRAVYEGALFQSLSGQKDDGDDRQRKADAEPGQETEHWEAPG